MSTEPNPEPTKKTPDKTIDYATAAAFDPDSFRMTVGEHLEELRTRLVLALSGLAVAVLSCLLFSDKVMIFFRAPLDKQLDAHGLSREMFFIDLTDPFMTYLKVTMIVAAAIAGPWMIYQIWLFAAAGLYPHERKMITRYIPLSIALFIAGLVFVYVLVLPLSIKFFIEFSNTISPSSSQPSVALVDNPTPTRVPILDGDPRNTTWGDVWFDRLRGKLKIAVPITGDSVTTHYKVRVFRLEPESLMTPIPTIGVYIDLVITFMLTFGIAFQLPLVLLAVVSIGIVDVSFLRKNRKIVYFIMTVAAAFLAPGDIVTSMLALLIPLMILYEFGLLLVVFADKRKAATAD